MLRVLTIVLLLVVSLAACAGTSKPDSAKQRADRLNSEKAKARELIESSSYQAAIDVLEPLSQKASADHQLFTMLGESYAKLAIFEKAVSNYEQAIRLSYADYHPHLGLATLLMEHGKIGRALTEFELAERFGAQDPLTRYNFGLALFKMGRREKALEQWRRAFEMEKDNPKYAEAVGIALSGVDDAKAVRHFRIAAELGAGAAGFHNNYGLALQRMKALDRAREEFEEAVRLAPESEEFRFNLAALLMISRAFEEALAAWDLLVEREGPRWSYLVYRGEALLALKRFEGAIASVEAIAQDIESGRLAPGSDRMDRVPPGLNDAFEILAMSYRGKGDPDKAADYIRRALALEPLKPSHLNNYGVILAESGKIGEAKIQWLKVLEIDAENVTARENLSAFER